MSVILAGVAGILFSGQAFANCAAEGCVRVGTYNIKTLGAATAPADTDSELEELARRIDLTMKLDAVVLTEIDVKSASWARLKALLDGRGFRIAGEGSFGGDDPARQQHIVIAYRASKVEATGSASELPIETKYDDGKGCAYDSVRPPLAVSLKADKLDFVLVGVHLKSQRPVAEIETCDDDIRKHQADKIVAWIAGQPKPENDYLVVGDVNSTFEEGEFSPFRDAGFVTAMAELPKWSGTVSYLPDGGQLIDHILYRSGATNFVNGSGFALKVPASQLKTYLNTQSDHVPVAADFLTGQDED